MINISSMKCENQECNEELGYDEPTMCCSGSECGCMGQPTEPPVCSQYCFYMTYPWMKESNGITDEKLAELKLEKEEHEQQRNNL